MVFQLFSISVHTNEQNWLICKEFLRHFDTFKPILPILYRYCIRYRLFDISICISRLIMETMLRRICKPIRYIEILPSTSMIHSCREGPVRNLWLTSAKPGLYYPHLDHTCQVAAGRGAACARPHAWRNFLVTSPLIEAFLTVFPLKSMTIVTGEQVRNKW